MEKLKQSFPPDLDYVIALDTTLSVTEGIRKSSTRCSRPWCW